MRNTFRIEDVKRLTDAIFISFDHDQNFSTLHDLRGAIISDLTEAIDFVRKYHSDSYVGLAGYSQAIMSISVWDNL